MPAASTSKLQTKKGGKSVKAEDEDEIQESDSGEEYEVESISKHRGTGDSLEYRVSWVGYDTEWDTWEPAAHVTDATEALAAYWESLGRPPPGARKRGRPSTASIAASKPESTSSQAQPLSNKKVRSSAASARPIANGSAKRAGKQEPESESSMEPESTHEDSWEKYDKVSNWEPVVRSVDSVEAAAGSSLDVWMTMQGGEKIRVSNSIANKRCPQKMIKFYEEHLKWKPVGQEDD
ncbi:hypothetical protein IAT38_001803 [Cryptococcus sp. DSM 104549]